MAAANEAVLKLFGVRDGQSVLPLVLRLKYCEAEAFAPAFGTAKTSGSLPSFVSVTV